MGLSWPKYWSGVPFPPPGDHSDPRIKLVSPVVLRGRRILHHTRKALCFFLIHQLLIRGPHAPSSSGPIDVLEKFTEYGKGIYSHLPVYYKRIRLKIQVSIQTEGRHGGCVGRGGVPTLSELAPLAKEPQVSTSPEALQFPSFGDHTETIM